MPRRKFQDPHKPNLCAFVKIDFRKLEPWQIPVIRENALDKNWKQICKQLEEQIYCLLVNSALYGDEEEYVVFDQDRLYSVLEEKSERTMTGLSLLSHCCRFENWTNLEIILKKIHELKVINDEYWRFKVEESCEMLLDPRIIHLISCISDLKPNEVKNILAQKSFQIHFVDLHVPIKGWVTPVGIAINIQTLSQLEKTDIIAFTRILGHELTHFMSRISNNNFSISTPERAKTSSTLQDLISELQVFHPQLENHIESGLLFELGFIGAKFSYKDSKRSKEMCHELYKVFLNREKALPLFNEAEKIESYRTIEFKEQFGFYPSESHPSIEI